MKHRVVWCGVASKAHLAYGASWVRQLAESGAAVRVELMPPLSFFNARPVSVQDARAALPATVELSEWTSQPARSDEQLWLLSVGAVGIKPWLATFGRAPHRSACVVTDEGLGSYGNWRSRRQARKREGGREPILSMRSAAVSAATKLLTTQRWALHLQRGEQWALNPAISSEFHRQANRGEPNGRAIFLSQPWPDLGVMTESQHLEHIAEVAAACPAAGLDFAVHPHPGESASRYADWQVVASNGVAEFNPEVINASVLLGATSTAMLNLAAVQGVPAIRVATPELDQLDRDLTPRQASLLRFHLGESRPTDELPRSLTELMYK